jgi:hypothetical protein
MNLVDAVRHRLWTWTIPAVSSSVIHIGIVLGALSLALHWAPPAVIVVPLELLETEPPPPKAPSPPPPPPRPAAKPIPPPPREIPPARRAAQAPPVAMVQSPLVEAKPVEPRKEQAASDARKTRSRDRSGARTHGERAGAAAIAGARSRR